MVETANGLVRQRSGAADSPQPTYTNRKSLAVKVKADAPLTLKPWVPMVTKYELAASVVMVT
jgi:hypothetical protein